MSLMIRGKLFEQIPVSALIIIRDELNKIAKIETNFKYYGFTRKRNIDV